MEVEDWRAGHGVEKRIKLASSECSRISGEPCVPTVEEKRAGRSSGAPVTGPRLASSISLASGHRLGRLDAAIGLIQGAVLRLVGNCWHRAAGCWRRAPGRQASRPELLVGQARQVWRRGTTRLGPTTATFRPRRTAPASLVWKRWILWLFHVSCMLRAWPEPCLGLPPKPSRAVTVAEGMGRNNWHGR